MLFRAHHSGEYTVQEAVDVTIRAIRNKNREVSHSPLKRCMSHSLRHLLPGITFKVSTTSQQYLARDKLLTPAYLRDIQDFNCITTPHFYICLSHETNLSMVLLFLWNTMLSFLKFTRQWYIFHLCVVLLFFSLLPQNTRQKQVEWRRL